MKHQFGEGLQINTKLASISQERPLAAQNQNQIELFQGKELANLEQVTAIQTFDREKEMKKLRIIAWLQAAAISFHEDYSDKIKRVLPETGHWILGDDRYVAWKHQNRSELLWVKGNRGCGKSFLASVVIQDLKIICETPQNLDRHSCDKVALAYVYCNSLEADKVNVSKIFTSIIEQLIRQLSGQGIDDRVERIYDGHEGNRSLDQFDIDEVMNSVIGQFKKVFIVVNGLDELHALKSVPFRGVCRMLRSLTKPRNNETLVKLVAFSRPEDAIISDLFADCSTIVIDHGANEADIGKFIDMKLSGDGLHIKHNPTLLKDVKEELLTRSEGVFLWVDLVINSLKGERIARDIHQKIKDVPGGLDQQYQASLQRIMEKKPKVRDFALRILLWIVNARRPLHKSELREALSVRPDMTRLDEDEQIPDDVDLVRDCNDLIFVDRNDCYQLLHSSLKDYLARSAINGFNPPNEWLDFQKTAEEVLGETCLTYLNFQQFAIPAKNEAELDLLMQKNPLTNYAATYWGEHVARNQNTQLIESARRLVMHPARRDLSMHCVFRSRKEPIIFTGPSTPLHIICIFGLEKVAETISGLFLDYYASDGFGFTPLDHALRFQNRKMCRWLLERQQNSPPEDPLAGRLFGVYGAASNDWSDIVKLLVDLGYDPNRSNTKGHSTPLHAAARNGSLRVSKILISASVDLNARDIDGNTPLLDACERNHIDIAKKLIDLGADVTTSGRHGATALHHAAMHGQLELVQALLDNAANIDATCDGTWNFCTALHLAGRRGNTAVLEYLIRKGADLNKATPAGLTPLQYAAKNGQGKCLILLLEAGAEVTVAENGCNLLHLATLAKGPAVIKALFAHQPTLFNELLPQINDNGETPLHEAARRGRVEIIEFLIRHGGMPAASTEWSCSPLQSAISTGKLTIAKLLLEACPKNVFVKGKFGWSALHYVAHHSKLHPHLNRIIPLLLDAGSDPEAVDDDGERAIHTAVQANNLDFIASLQDSGACFLLNPLSNSSESPLFIAVSRGFEEIVSYLLDQCKTLN